MLRTMRSIHSSVVNSPADAAVLLEVEGRDLDRRQLVDPERVLALRLLVVLEAHVDLRPDAAHQQPLVVAHVLVGMWRNLLPKLYSLGPVVGVDEPNLHLVDEGVFPVLLDLALRLRRLVGPDVVVGERVVDDLQSHLDRDLVRRGAVLAEQELEHEDGNVRADLDLADEVLAHDLAGEERGSTLSSSASRAGDVPLLMLKLRDEPGCRWVSGTAPRRLSGPERRRAATATLSSLSRNATVTGLPGSKLHAAGRAIEIGVDGHPDRRRPASLPTSAAAARRARSKRATGSCRRAEASR